QGLRGLDMRTDYDTQLSRACMHPGNVALQSATVDHQLRRLVVTKTRPLRARLFSLNHVTNIFHYGVGTLVIRPCMTAHAAGARGSPHLEASKSVALFPNRVDFQSAPAEPHPRCREARHARPRCLHDAGVSATAVKTRTASPDRYPDTRADTPG